MFSFAPTLLFDSFIDDIYKIPCPYMVAVSPIRGQHSAKTTPETTKRPTLPLDVQDPNLIEYLWDAPEQARSNV